MQITIVCFGEIKDKELLALQQQYLKLCSKWLQIKIIELKDKSVRSGEESNYFEWMKSLITKHLSVEKPLLYLDKAGEQFSSEAFNGLIQDFKNHPGSLQFVIGGSIGLRPELFNHFKSKKALSFSKMTFPHKLFRLMLLEQVFRAESIFRNHPYHK